MYITGAKPVIEHIGPTRHRMRLHRRPPRMMHPKTLVALGIMHHKTLVDPGSLHLVGILARVARSGTPGIAVPQMGTSHFSSWSLT